MGLGALLAGYVVWKIWQRQRFLRKLRIARINPDDLLRKIKAGEDGRSVDRRSRMSGETPGTKLPRALPGAPTGPTTPPSARTRTWGFTGERASMLETASEQLSVT